VASFDSGNKRQTDEQSFDSGKKRQTDEDAISTAGTTIAMNTFTSNSNSASVQSMYIEHNKQN